MYNNINKVLWSKQYNRHILKYINRILNRNAKRFTSINCVNKCII